MARVYVVGTADTKGPDLGYLTERVRSAGAEAILVDVGTVPHDSPGDVTPAEVAAYHPDGADAVFADDRGEAIAAMSTAVALFIEDRLDDVAGLLGAGGSGGTALATAAMRVLPIGVPKMMVSTVASANVAPYVGPSDIAMMYSVADVAGLNRISRRVLGNAAHAMAGMVVNGVPQSDTTKPAVGLTMFGVTTPLITKLCERLAADYDPLVFHATGTGGQSMEKLVASNLVAGVLDLTTTEVADYVVGGVFPCLPERFDVIAETQVPYVGSVGALDMVNFAARHTVPERFDDRHFHIHNPNVTLMRTTVDENIAMGTFIADKLNACDGPVRFLLPTGGVSLIDAPDMPFHDPAADEALFETIESRVEQTETRRVERIDANINDDAFVDAVMRHFDEITHTRSDHPDAS